MEPVLTMFFFCLLYTDLLLFHPTFLTLLFFQKIDQMDSDGLVKLQVEQLEKEKKELAERLRIISKRVDHIERAFRKEERPLVLADYERQQVEDLAAHELLVRQTRDEAKAKHDADVELKNRLARMLGDYRDVKKDIQQRQAGEFERRKREADAKIAEAKKEYKARVLKERAEARERAAQEEQERQQEEERRAQAEGQFGRASFRLVAPDVFATFLFFFLPTQYADVSCFVLILLYTLPLVALLSVERLENEARQAKENEMRAQIEARAKEAEDKARAARLAAREAEQQADREKIQAQLRREEEAMARRQNKSAGAESGGGGGAWTRGASAPSAPVAPTKVAPGSWRAKEEERKRLEAAGGAPTPAAAAPVAPAAPATRPSFKLAPRSVPVPSPTTETPASNGSSSTTTPSNGPLKSEQQDDGFQAVPERGQKFVRGQGKWSRGRV